MSKKGIKVNVKTGEAAETEYEMAQEEQALTKEQNEKEQLWQKFCEEKADKESQKEQAEFEQWKKENNY